MVVKNFVFRQDWAKGGWYEDSTCTQILALKSPNKEFLKQHLVKKDRNHIIINFVT